MKKILLYLFTLFLLSCANEELVVTLNQLNIKSSGFSSIIVSGQIITEKPEYSLEGGYILGTETGIDSIYYIKDLTGIFTDTILNLIPKKKYWIQTFTKNNDFTYGDKIDFTVSNYQIIFEKRVTISNEMDLFKYPNNTTSFYDFQLDENDNVILAGWVRYSPSYPFMVKIDKEGKLKWQHTLKDIPEQFSSYSKVFITKENQYIGLVKCLNKLYMIRLSSEGIVISNNSISIAETNDFFMDFEAQWIDYDKSTDTFSAITGVLVGGILSDPTHPNFKLKHIVFDSNGNVYKNEYLNTNAQFSDLGKLLCTVGSDKYYRSDLSSFCKLDKNMNVKWRRKLQDYWIMTITARDNDNLLISTVDKDNSSVIQLFQSDSLGNIKTLDKWQFHGPYINSAMMDKNKNTFICGENSPYLFNGFGCLSAFSNENKFIMKEKDFGYESRISGKITITKFLFMRMMSDESLLIIGLWNPDFYDGSMSQVYLRKFSY